MISKVIHGLHFYNLRGDFFGGLVAAVIALPLALAFGVSSGAGAVTGLYGAIFLGFFAAMFGGTPAQASGPTGPMTVVFAGMFVLFSDEPALVFTTVILGGGVLILMGALGIGRYISLVPYPVISGFMSGIGAIIIILQVAPVLGYQSAAGVVGNLMAIPEIVSSPKVHATAIGCLALVIMYGTPAMIGKYIPPSLLALLVCTPVARLFFPDAPVIGEIPQGFPSIIVPTFHVDALTVMVEEACVIAFLCAIDSLLTSLVCDNMTRTQHDSNRELIGQGIGNMIAGLFGGLPGAGATVRSVANIRSGGRTPLSGMLMGVVLLVTLLWLGPLAEQIPLAVLAGILLKVGVDIIDWRFLRHVFQAPRADVVIMTIVLVVTVAVDLITAVGVGVVLASILFVKEMADLELANMRIITEEHPEIPLTPEENSILERNAGKIVLIHVDGPMSFGSAKNMVRRLETVPGLREFSSCVLDVSDVPAIDGTSAMAIDDMLGIIRAHKQHLFFVGMQPHVTKVLNGLGVLSEIRPGHRYAKRLDALRHAAQAAGSTHPDDQPVTQA
ncbi:MAG: SulP family inorganic anion transporter [Nitrospirales bacterium]|nr:SulP family inorganic anion transporter [Nitrospira sp.]MDR4500734.1 SulP family inorganic anion transporter [Nitrospirales bacterium]